MPISPPTISDLNRAVLNSAYQKLLGKRQDMIAGLKPIMDDAYRRGVLVDSIISGLMAQFHDLARNESARKDELQAFGGTLQYYSDSFIDNFTTGLTKIRPI